LGGAIQGQPERQALFDTFSEFIVNRSHSLDLAMERRWRQLLRYLRRHGAIKTSQHVAHLTQSQGYPVYYSIRLVRHLLKRSDLDAAGRVIAALDRAGVEDPLMDELHSSWLWCSGSRRAAISFALNSAKYWHKSYLVHHVGTLYRLMFKRTGSEYSRRKSEYYWRIAHLLVEQEEKEEAESAEHLEK
jgi:hypothetical protein